MITIFTLIFITVAVLFVATFIFSIGGTLLTVFAADLIVAVFVIWLVVYYFKKRRK